MDLAKLKSLYERNSLPENSLKEAIAFMETVAKIVDPDLADEAGIKKIVSELVASGKNTVGNFVIMMRYFLATGNTDRYIQLTRYTGGLDVIENILKRLETRFGKEKMDLAMQGLSIPILGTDPSDMAIFTARFMDNLKKNFNDKDIAFILDGNNHGVPESAFISDKTLYEASSDLDEYLEKLHAQKVAVLQKHADLNKVWFEQKINQEVVDFVKANQEILSAVRKDDKLYMTKIPYDIDGYLHATDPKEKKYLGCHCPFAREAMKNGDTSISPLWCHCSAGFEKLSFEFVLGTKLKIEILETILDGNERCRFAISLDGIKHK
ncbi:MAG TPA: hypothetical protein PLH02_00730 [Bacillota bacterium]|nr:hypothetical protein [Bacillota bacterium]HPF42351.1 hypothetical protein [Bacillota bacterium]HPJ86138.1 hypothetical protein [Bacillota bacterium]HPQ61390.1 hypothetical protein [Bacillota bacterium]HRX92129.1 hypothetical protein [Candidatus Izemoplasmatales bacterium]